jgi:hypothetical protein
MPIFSGVTISGGISYTPPPVPQSVGSLSMDGSALGPTYAANTPDLGFPGDFTIEYFTYITNVNKGDMFTFGLTKARITGSSFYYGVGFANRQLTVNGVTNAWKHWAITRSGSTVRAFLDGTQIDTVSDSNDTTANNAIKYIAVWNDVLQGQITNFRVVKGTALYTSNFTVPTSPLTAVPNTVLLLLNATQATLFTDSSGTGKIPASTGGTWSSNSPFPQ